MPYADPEKRKLSSRKISLAFYHANPAYRLKRLQRASELRVEWRKKIFELLGGSKCIKCGVKDYRALQIDHKNGGGRKQFKENPHFIKPKPYYEHINKHISEYQVLCSNCNWIKRFEAREVPNKRHAI